MFYRLDCLLMSTLACNCLERVLPVLCSAGASTGLTGKLANWLTSIVHGFTTAADPSPGVWVELID